MLIINKDQFKIGDLNINTNQILKSVNDTNKYLFDLSMQFKNLNIDLIESLGNRNLSGTIGEIFKYFLVSEFKMFKMNPHSDGYPDVIFLNNEDKLKLYKNGFNYIEGKKIPLKQSFSPFKGGGIEIKCTMGTLKSNNKNKLIKKEISRIDRLSNLSYSAHHRHDINLLALYIDFYEEKNFTPQILSVFFSKILISDWAQMSLGTSNSKTTSATRINNEGIKKIKSNCLITINNLKYLEKFKKIGINIEI